MSGVITFFGSQMNSFFYEFVSGEKLSDCQNLTDLEPFFSFHRNSDLWRVYHERTKAFISQHRKNRRDFSEIIDLSFAR